MHVCVDIVDAVRVEHAVMIFLINQDGEHKSKGSGVYWERVSVVRQGGWEADELLRL